MGTSNDNWLERLILSIPWVKSILYANDQKWIEKIDGAIRNLREDGKPNNAYKESAINELEKIKQ